MLLSKQNDQTNFILVVLLFPTQKDELSYILNFFEYFIIFSSQFKVALMQSNAT